MVKSGDILEVVSNMGGHAFSVGERLIVQKVMLFNVLECKGNKTSDILHVSETEPVWDK